MQSYISVNLESSGRIESSKRKSKGNSSGAHHRRTLPPRERFKYWLRKVITVLFSQVGVGSLLVCYTILGAMLFTSIESPVDSRRLAQVASLRSTTVIQLWNVTQNYNVIYGTEWRREVDHIVRRFQNGLVREIRLGFEGKDAKPAWTFPQALMFSLSVYTTIGYGNLTPKTDWGKATTCLYALFGIPLLLLYMANVGDLLATSFQQFYRTLDRCKTRVEKMRELSRERRRRRRMSVTGENEEDGDGLDDQHPHDDEHHHHLRRLVLPAASERSLRSLGETVTKTATSVGDDYSRLGQVKREMRPEQIGQSQRATPREAQRSRQHEENNEWRANEVTIPISTCLAVFFCYILFGSILFSWWEGWEYFEGSYFCFVSLVTIGFSDMVPGQRRHSSLPGGGELEHHSPTVSTLGEDEDAGGEAGLGGGRSASIGPGGANGSGSNGREESLDHVDGQVILCSIYILFGMALMGMCFHLTQERFFTTAKKLGRALHLI